MPPASLVPFKTAATPCSDPLPDGFVVAIGLVSFAVLWLLALASTSLTPPVDSIEQLTWVNSLEWGYYKHPPLPTWLLWPAVHAFGVSTATISMFGAACTLISLGMIWSLLKNMRGPAYAHIALLAILCITYYNGRLNYYNHNVVLMLASTASAAFCWQAFSSQLLRWWFAVGIALGLGALAKYQIAITALSVLFFWLHQRAWRHPVHRRGLLLAALVALLVFIPHVQWLRSHGFGPIEYALQSSLGANLDTTERLIRSATWILDQLLNRALPAWLLLGLTIAASRCLNGNPPAATKPTTNMPATQSRGSARSLLMAWGAIPLLFMCTMGLVGGADLQLHWGTAFILFTVPAAMELFPEGFWQRVDLPKASVIFVLIQVILLGLCYLKSPNGPERLRDRHWRSFDSSLLSARIANQARRELGGPIHILVGDPATTGALSLRLPEHPLVLIDQNFERSPWLSLDHMKRCGAVLLGTTTEVVGGHLLGAPFQGMSWRTIPRETMAGACPQQ
jgi:hypothetical protein